MEPLYPACTGKLEDLARELIAVSAQLEGRLAPVVLAEIEAFRIIGMSERIGATFSKACSMKGCCPHPRKKAPSAWAFRQRWPVTDFLIFIRTVYATKQKTCFLCPTHSD